MICWLVLILGFADAIKQMSMIDDMTKEEAHNLREVIDTLNEKHKEYSASIQNYIKEGVQDQSDIKRFAGLWNVSFSFLF